jgi:hypothetical protein
MLCGVAMFAAGFAIALCVNPETATPVYELRVTDHDGNLYIAGRGDDCPAAFQGAKFPADWRELICVRAQ